jgi:hypothetical protein
VESLVYWGSVDGSTGLEIGLEVHSVLQRHCAIQWVWPVRRWRIWQIQTRKPFLPFLGLDHGGSADQCCSLCPDSSQPKGRTTEITDTRVTADTTETGLCRTQELGLNTFFIPHKVRRHQLCLP